MDTLKGDATLRSKRKLIRKFIEENLPHIVDIDDIPETFENFWAREQMAAFEKMSKDEQLDPVNLQAVLGNYLFTEHTPLRDEVLDMLPAKPKLLERKPISERITAKMLRFVETFISGMGSRL